MPAEAPPRAHPPATPILVETQASPCLARVKGGHAPVEAHPPIIRGSHSHARKPRPGHTHFSGNSTEAPPGLSCYTAITPKLVQAPPMVHNRMIRKTPPRAHTYDTQVQGLTAPCQTDLTPPHPHPPCCRDPYRLARHSPSSTPPGAPLPG